MTEFKTEPHLCEHCGYAWEIVSAMPGTSEPPRTGDITICLNCGMAHIREPASWRLLTGDDFIALSTSDKRWLGRMRERHVEGKRLGIIGDLTARDRHS